MFVHGRYEILGLKSPSVDWSGDAGKGSRRIAIVCGSGKTIPADCIGRRFH
jgi:hypothetical protein